jgi:hypothetical protein
MDYSSDACQNQFTQGQIERMYYVWSIYRKGNEICSIGYKLFEIEILADSYPDETHWALQSTDGKFQWDTLEQNSDIYFEYPANIKTIQEICLDATKDYTFTIFDDSKDGIESPGYYAIRYGGVQLKRNSAFGQKDVTSFSGGSKSPTPKPTTKPPTTKPTAKPPTPKPTTKPPTRKPTTKPPTRKPTTQPRALAQPSLGVSGTPATPAKRQRRLGRHRHF